MERRRLGGADVPTCSGHGRCLPPVVPYTRPTCVCDSNYGGSACEIPLAQTFTCNEILQFECVPDPALVNDLYLQPALLLEHAWRCATTSSGGSSGRRPTRRSEPSVASGSSAIVPMTRRPSLARAQSRPHRDEVGSPGAAAQYIGMNPSHVVAPESGASFVLATASWPQRRVATRLATAGR